MYRTFPVHTSPLGSFSALPRGLFSSFSFALSFYTFARKVRRTSYIRQKLHSLSEQQPYSFQNGLLLVIKPRTGRRRLPWIRASPLILTYRAPDATVTGPFWCSCSIWSNHRPYFWRTGSCCALCFTLWTGPHLKLGGGSGVLGPLIWGFWCFCGVPRPPKAQTHAVTSSVDPTNPFLQAAIAPCDTLLLSIFEAPICSFLHSFFLHDDESEALAFLPCTLSFSEAKPFLDTRARPVASYCLLHCSLLPWSPTPVDRSVSLFWQSATSYLDRCQASLRTAAHSMGPLSALLH